MEKRCKSGHPVLNWAATRSAVECSITEFHSQESVLYCQYIVIYYVFEKKEELNDLYNADIRWKKSTVHPGLNRETLYRLSNFLPLTKCPGYILISVHVL